MKMIGLLLAISSTVLQSCTSADAIKNINSCLQYRHVANNDRIKSTGFVVARNQFESYYFFDAHCSEKKSLLIRKVPEDFSRAIISNTNHLKGGGVPTAEAEISATIVDEDSFVISAKIDSIRVKRYFLSELR